ncbi:hypothetical protein ACA040_002217 [Xenophilus aerolatus]
MSSLSPEHARELMQKMREAAAGTTGREMHVCVNSGELADLLEHLNRCTARLFPSVALCGARATSAQIDADEFGRSS